MSSVGYKNGNYVVLVSESGTKTRLMLNEEEAFLPSFAENCDVKITEKCSQDCPYCYEGCTKEGKHADILNQNWIYNLHPYTELALNGNDMDHPDLINFLIELKKQKVFANITVNQNQLHNNLSLLKDLQKRKLLWGIGVSFIKITPDFLRELEQLDNVIVHVVAGLITPEELEELHTLSHKKMKILILGYKNKGRGRNFLEEKSSTIYKRIGFLKNNITKLINLDNFASISFDNLAIKQLEIRKEYPDKEWSKYYMGDDGNYTFYIDMVNKKYSKNSLSQQTFDLLDTVDEMFKDLQERKVNG